MKETIRINPGEIIGSIKKVNGGNLAPAIVNEKAGGNIRKEFGELHLPVTRLHDAPLENAVYDEEGKPIKGWPSNVDRWDNTNYTVYQAIKVSKNTIAARWGQLVGLSEMYEFAHDTLEIDTLDENDAVSLASMCLGGNSYGISPYQLAGAYMMYGNGGMFYSLHSYVSIEDYKGDIVLEPDINRVQAISEDTAYIMNRLLRGVMESGGGTGAGYSTKRFDTLGKTGTTNEVKDIWFVGLTPYYVSAFWYGYTQNEPMQSWYSHSMHPGLKVFKAVMDDEFSDEEKYPDLSWPEAPDNIVTRTFCMESGAIAGPGCTNTRTGYYKEDNLPSASCSLHYAG